MTIFAGILSRGDAGPIEDAACASVQGALTRHPADRPRVFRSGRIFFAKVDVGAYREEAFCAQPSGSVSMLAGEPLLDRGDSSHPESRTADLESLHRSWDQGDFSGLSRSSGVFAAAHYDPQSETLSLIADKLGIRPLYVWLSERLVVFASALRILEGVDLVTKEMDVRGVVELVSLGYSLGPRTPYSKILMLGPGEVLRISGPTVASSRYWRWDAIPVSDKPEPALLAEAHRRFSLGMRRRQRGDTGAVAFLSGGLDSRCIVSELRAQGVNVRTFNFARPGLQDQIFAARFAQEVGTIHYQSPHGHPIRPNLSMVLARAWDPQTQPASSHVERPHFVWSGDGGSVGVGHVYMSRAVVDLLRQGRVAIAVDRFLAERGAGLHRRLYRGDVSARLAGLLQRGIREELAGIHSPDPARDFHIFLMHTDQHRHLFHHFEDIDLHRMEFQLPFFDSSFLEVILSAPIDACLGHRFYMRWLSRFPSVALSVPWQAYPGHEPCPLPVDDVLPTQWDRARNREELRAERSAYLRMADEVLASREFPKPLLSKAALRMLSWLYRARWRDYRYAISAAQTFQRYWAISKGKYVLGEAPSDS